VKIFQDQEVQTTLTYDDHGFTPFHINVYLLLRLLGQVETELEESNIEELVSSRLHSYLS
ncbi:hypothetical protein BgiMline_015961, partial [Biomphalaria glabrata]